MSTPIEIPTLPDDAAELLNDPRLADMVYEKRPGMPPARRLLEPTVQPKEGESRFLLLSPMFDEASEAPVEWVNKPRGAWGEGDGRGFDFITETPLFNEERPKPQELPDAWDYLGWMVASPRFVQVLRQYDAAAIRTKDIDWVFSDGQKMDGYVFLDICRLIHAYDYARSQVKVQMGSTSKYVIGVGPKRTLKTNIDSGIHIFREAYCRRDVYVSRELARALLTAGIRQVQFLDPANSNPL